MPGAQGPSEVFRIVKIIRPPRNSATESIPAALQAVRATVGSNTETDDDCWPAIFHRGRSGVKALPNPNIACGDAEASASMVEYGKKANKNG